MKRSIFEEREIHVNFGTTILLIMKADVGLVYTLNAPTQPINNIELFYTLTPELTK